ncbi:hypothetical protein [Streptomyces sp. NPDC005231]|uniref:hypothetical protein n=1 Tax=Streptomyces sp. NPDC005231 TaxID=3157026 RepID=UPI0033A8BA6B
MDKLHKLHEIYAVASLVGSIDASRVLQETQAAFDAFNAALWPTSAQVGFIIDNEVREKAGLLIAHMKAQAGGVPRGSGMDMEDLARMAGLVYDPLGRRVRGIYANQLKR